MTWVIPKATAYGGILLNSGGQVILREPANHYDGYVWTFAKTRPQGDETPEHTARRGVRGEIGTMQKSLACYQVSIRVGPRPTHIS